MGKLHLIPDFYNLKKTQEQCEHWNAAFEYNDFFQPDLLDNKLELKKRIQTYKTLNRNKKNDTLHGAFFDLCINSTDKKIADISKQRMRQSMDVAQQLECKAVIFHTNMIAGFEVDYYLKKWKDDNVEFMNVLLKEYDEIHIYMENMFDRSPEMLAALAEEMKDNNNFGVCLDVAHSNISGTPLQEWFSYLSPYIKHLHINDNDGKNDLHQPVGTGAIDWDCVQRLISENHIQASCLVEVASYEAKETSLQYMKQRGIYPFDRTDNLRI